MKEALTRGERIELRGFGVFVVKPRKRGVGAIPVRAKKSQFHQAKQFASSPAKNYRRMTTAISSLMIQTTTTSFRSRRRNLLRLEMEGPSIQLWPPFWHKAFTNDQWLNRLELCRRVLISSERQTPNLRPVSGGFTVCSFSHGCHYNPGGNHAGSARASDSGATARHAAGLPALHSTCLLLIRSLSCSRYAFAHPALIGEGRNVLSFFARNSLLARDGTLSRVSLLQSECDTAVLHPGAAAFSRRYFRRVHQDQICHPVAPCTLRHRTGGPAGRICGWRCRFRVIGVLIVGPPLEPAGHWIYFNDPLLFRLIAKWPEYLSIQTHPQILITWRLDWITGDESELDAGGPT